MIVTPGAQWLLAFVQLSGGDPKGGASAGGAAADSPVSEANSAHSRPSTLWLHRHLLPDTDCWQSPSPSGSWGPPRR